MCHFHSLIHHLYTFPKKQQKHCPVEKYAVDGDGVIEYHSSLPKLEQFTLCAWMRFTNHSGDHTIFTYSGEFNLFSILFDEK